MNKMHLIFIILLHLEQIEKSKNTTHHKQTKHKFPNDDGNFVDDPWYLTKTSKGKMIKSIKSVILPTRFGVNFKKAFTKGNELAGMKTHDWHNFLRVRMCTMVEVIYIIYYIPLELFYFFHLFYIPCVINQLEHSVCSIYYASTF